MRTFFSIVAPRLVATAISVGLVIWAASSLIDLSASARIRSLAAAIEKGAQPKLEAFDWLHGDHSTTRVLAGCDAPSLRALVTVRLKELDLAFVTSDPVRADRAYEGAETAVRAALSCAPLNGNMWLRLSMLETGQRGPSPKAIEFVKLSYLTAPSEGWIVRARVGFTSQLFAAGNREIEAELRSDLRTLVSHDSPERVAEMFLAAPASVRQIYREWADLLPETRKGRIEEALKKRGGSLAGA